MNGGSSLPDACMDVAVNHMECAVLKRDYAYQVAQNLAGKEAVDRVFPNYEDNKKKALDLIDVYRTSGAAQTKGSFWG